MIGQPEGALIGSGQSIAKMKTSQLHIASEELRSGNAAGGIEAKSEWMRILEK